MPQVPALMNRRLAMATLAVAAAAPGRLLADSGFSNWLSGFSAKAGSAGVSDTALKALRRAEYLPSVIKSDRRPAETARSLQDYISSAASPQRIKGGQKALSRYPTLLKKIERKYGVPKEVIVAIWGMESSFGAVRGSASVLSTLATLAYEGRRRDLFEAELLAALEILTAGDVSPSHMKGSYAGAMGHTQFMPSSYLAHAEDFNRDGARDIWSDDPTDALASTAAYLRAKGWTTGQPWAIEARLPKGFDLALTGRIYPRRLRDWGKMGVTDVAGRTLKGADSGALILPAGPAGPIFMIFQNFHVLKTYNYADSYVIGVGHLSDRLSGGRAIQASYPKKPWGMTTKELQALQKRLNKLGFQAGRPDGVIGEKGRAAIRAYQKSRGMPVTGVPSTQLLASLS